MIKLIDKFAKEFVSEEEIRSAEASVTLASQKIIRHSGAGSEFLGWYDLPDVYDKDEVERIKASAEKIKKDSDVLIVIGIGGSYLGAKAAIDFLRSPYYNSMTKDTPDIYFVGNSLSGDDLNDVISICKDKRISVNIISKSGSTTETALAFRIVRKLMSYKYTNVELQNRLYITTDKNKGALCEFAMRERMDIFGVPDDIGGRYSVLTPVGLLPIAVCGADIDAMLDGAKEMKRELMRKPFNDAYKYAMYRNIFYKQGKDIELLCGYEPALRAFTEWWKQLFGESEGKQGKGIFPAAAIFSTDLHSMGQYIQDGKRILFETVLKQREVLKEMYIPPNAVDIDGLNFLAGGKLSDINEKAFTGTLLSHVEGGVPNLVIEYGRRDERTFGQLMFFFWLACAASGYMLGVNPFDQPGVEGYKRNMYALIGKKGYEDIKNKLDEKMRALTGEDC